MKRFLSPLPAVLVFGSLAGCASGSSHPPAFCPQVAVLAQAQTLTTFLPGRSDVAAQITTARITGVAGSCTLEKNENLLEVTFQAGFSASNGPANNSAPLTLPYFIAITHGENIISKTDYTIGLNFDGNATTAQATTKPVTVELSNVPDSANTEILVGFAMTPDQLSYAAAHPAAGP